MAANKVGAALASVGALTDIDTALRNPLGTQVFDESGNEYIYLQGVASTAAGDWVVFYGDYTTVRAKTTPLPGRIAVAMAATVASTYGWYQIGGVVAVANITSSATDTYGLFATGTDGRAITTPAAANAFFNAFAYGTSSANVGKAFIDHPYCVGTATL